jgi:hypothetical protein
VFFQETTNLMMNLRRSGFKQQGAKFIELKLSQRQLPIQVRKTCMFKDL